jgi:hypothetical protein
MSPGTLGVPLLEGDAERGNDQTIKVQSVYEEPQVNIGQGAI